MAELDLTILMPCLNEAETLAFCVRQAMQAIGDSGRFAAYCPSESFANSV